MTWGFAVAAVVGAGTAAYSSSQANKRAKAAAGGLDDPIAYARQHPEMFGEKLKWEDASYKPLFSNDPGYADIARDTIAGNSRNFDASAALAGRTNDWITQDSLGRINRLDPTFQSSYSQQAQNTANGLRGELSSEDRNDITARRTEAQSLGGGGVNRQQVAADLGLSRLQLQQQGAANLTNNVNLLNLLDPMSRRLTPQSMFVDTQGAINSSIAENQFAATFDQSERNAELAWGLTPDPQKAGLANLLAGRSGLQAANPTQSVGLAAGVGAVQGAYGYYQGQQKQANQLQLAQAGQSYQPTQTYTPPAQTFATPYDQSNGFTAMSGAGQYSGGYSAAANPNTDQAYRDPGGLWSYFANQPRKY